MSRMPRGALTGWPAHHSFTARAPAHHWLPATVHALQAIQFSTADRFKIVGLKFSELAAC